MNCPACERAATHPHAGIYQNGCRACTVRGVAQSPHDIRQQFYAQLPQADRAAFIAAVAAEYERWSRLKSNPPATA